MAQVEEPRTCTCNCMFPQTTPSDAVDLIGAGVVGRAWFSVPSAVYPVCLHLAQKPGKPEKDGDAIDALHSVGLCQSIHATVRVDSVPREASFPGAKPWVFEIAAELNDGTAVGPWLGTLTHEKHEPGKDLNCGEYRFAAPVLPGLLPGMKEAWAKVKDLPSPSNVPQVRFRMRVHREVVHSKHTERGKTDWIAAEPDPMDGATVFADARAVPVAVKDEDTWAPLLGVGVTPTAAAVMQWVLSLPEGRKKKPCSSQLVEEMYCKLYEAWGTENAYLYHDPSLGQIQYGVSTQKLQFPEVTLGSRKGNCLDTALLIASGLAYRGLTCGLALRWTEHGKWHVLLAWPDSSRADSFEPWHQLSCAPEYPLTAPLGPLDVGQEACARSNRASWRCIDASLAGRGLSWKAAALDTQRQLREFPSQVDFVKLSAKEGDFPAPDVDSATVATVPLDELNNAWESRGGRHPKAPRESTPAAPTPMPDSSASSSPLQVARTQRSRFVRKALLWGGLPTAAVGILVLGLWSLWEVFFPTWPGLLALTGNDSLTRVVVAPFVFQEAAADPDIDRDVAEVSCKIQFALYKAIEQALLVDTQSFQRWQISMDPCGQSVGPTSPGSAGESKAPIPDWLALLARTDENSQVSPEEDPTLIRLQVEVGRSSRMGVYAVTLHVAQAGTNWTVGLPSINLAQPGQNKFPALVSWAEDDKRPLCASVLYGVPASDLAQTRCGRTSSFRLIAGDDKQFNEYLEAADCWSKLDIESVGARKKIEKIKSTSTPALSRILCSQISMFGGDRPGALRCLFGDKPTTLQLIGDISRQIDTESDRYSPPADIVCDAVGLSRMDRALCLSILYNLIGRHDVAVRAISKAIVPETNNDPSARYFRAETLFHAGQFASARDEYAWLANRLWRTQNDLGVALALNHLSLSLAYDGRYSDAIEAAQSQVDRLKGAGLSYDNALDTLASVNMLAGNYAAARNGLDEAMGQVGYPAAGIGYSLNLSKAAFMEAVWRRVDVSAQLCMRKACREDVFRKNLEKLKLRLISEVNEALLGARPAVARGAPVVGGVPPQATSNSESTVGLAQAVVAETVQLPSQGEPSRAELQLVVPEVAAFRALECLQTASFDAVGTCLRRAGFDKIQPGPEQDFFRQKKYGLFAELVSLRNDLRTSANSIRDCEMIEASAVNARNSVEDGAASVSGKLRPSDSQLQRFGYWGDYISAPVILYLECSLYVEMIGTIVYSGCCKDANRQLMDTIRYASKECAKSVEFGPNYLPARIYNAALISIIRIIKNSGNEPCIPDVLDGLKQDANDEAARTALGWKLPKDAEGDSLAVVEARHVCSLLQKIAERMQSGSAAAPADNEDVKYRPAFCAGLPSAKLGQ